MQTPGMIAHSGMPGAERLVVLRPVEHRAPALGIGVAEADELQASRRQHREDGRSEERRHDERGHRGQDLGHDDVAAALPADARRLEEIPVAQRERLHPQLPGTVGPAERAEDDDDVEQAGAAQVGRDHDDQREDRDHEQHVGDEREDAVADPAEVGGRHADEHRDEGGEPAGREGDDERLARAPDELREDVLALGGRAEPVGGRRAEARAGSRCTSGCTARSGRGRRRARRRTAARSRPPSPCGCAAGHARTCCRAARPPRLVTVGSRPPPALLLSLAVRHLRRANSPLWSGDRGWP